MYWFCKCFRFIGIFVICLILFPDYASSSTIDGFKDIGFSQVKDSLSKKGNPDIGRLEISRTYPSVISDSNTVKQQEIPSSFNAPPQNVWESSSMIEAAADSQYLVSPIREFFVGAHYRESWAAPVSVPVIRFNDENEELKLIRVSPGTQTETIIAENNDGIKFAIRTLNKDLERFLPKVMSGDIIIEMLQDQMSASYPYAELITTPLTEAAGIYSTSSDIVYVESSDRMTDSLKASPGNLAMKEKFVTGRLVREKYGHMAKDRTYSTAELLEYIPNHPEMLIDQSYMLKVRLFDMLINDWHRHEEQFIWIEIERKEGRNLVRPFPIGRDNALFLTDGILPTIATRKWAARRFQNFGPDIRDIKGMNYVARHIDRRFMNMLSREEWIRTAESLQSALTDSVIEQAVARLPDNLYEFRGGFFIDILKERRGRLIEFAERYYEVLSNKIDLQGTNRQDHFTVEEAPTNKLHIIRKTETDGSEPSFSDTLIVNTAYTEEVRIFGLDGDDTFGFSGVDDLPIRLHLIGGNGEEDFLKQSELPASGKKVITHSAALPRAADIEYSWRTEEITKEQIEKYGYNYQEFEYNNVRPLADFSINVDDGLFLGNGAVFTKYGFRKYPYASRHTLGGNVTFQSGSFNINYQGIFVRALGKADILIESNVSVPNSRTNFFGFGNETEVIGDRQFHAVNIDQYTAEALLRYQIGPDIAFLTGPFIEFFDPVMVEDRFVNTAASGLNPEGSDLDLFYGLDARFTFDLSNQQIIRKEGTIGQFGSRLVQKFDDRNLFLNLKANLKLYKYIDWLKTTFATRIGAACNFGDFEFYQANTLGGQVETSFNAPLLNSSNFRGTPRHRFTGQTVFYHNTDVRISLLDIKGTILPGELGILALADHGRVWNGGMDSSKWHYSMGGGLWFNALNRFVINTTWAKSDVDQRLTLEVGFMF